MADPVDGKHDSTPDTESGSNPSNATGRGSQAGGKKVRATARKTAGQDAAARDLGDDLRLPRH